MVELALVVALAVVLAQGTWLLLAPRTAGAPSSLGDADTAPHAALGARKLFGAARDEAPAAGRAVTGVGLALLGVIAGREGGSGRAIFARQGSRPVTVAVGEAVAEGIELREVHADHVVVARGGAPERIEIERRVARAAPQPSLAPGAPSAARR